MTCYIIVYKAPIYIRVIKRNYYSTSGASSSITLFDFHDIKQCFNPQIANSFYQKFNSYRSIDMKWIRCFTFFVVFVMLSALC